MRSLFISCLCAALLPNLAQAAQFLTPINSWPLSYTHSGLALAPNGNIYASDELGTVDYFSSQGTPLGSWPATSSATEYNGPQGIAVDRQGFVYVVFTNGLVEKFTGTGELVWSFTDSLCDQGRAITVDHSGNIYIGSFGTIGSVVEFNHAGKLVRAFPSHQAFGVEVDAVGNVYTAGRDLLEKYSPHGDLLDQQAGGGACGHVYSFDLVVDAQGFVIAANPIYGNVLFLSGDLGCQSAWTMPGPPDGVVPTLPSHLAYDAAGYLYVQDTMYDRVVKYRLNTATATTTATWGQVKATYR